MAGAAASDAPGVSGGMVRAGIHALGAGSSRPPLQRMAEGLGAWLWQAGIAPRAPRRPRYFLDHNQFMSVVERLAQRYPALVRVRRVGVSSETRAGRASRPIVAMTITNHAAPANRPRALHIAGIHPNEVANTHVLLGWVEHLLSTYGRNPRTTRLLDSRIIDFIPMANPDGTDHVGAGYAASPGGNLRQRKNTSSPDGVNINRNYRYKWRSDGGSKDPKHRDFAGPAAASEAETQAVEGYIRATRPGIVLDWHSFGQMVLWPWGYTTGPTPDEAGFAAIGRAFAAINGYHPMKGSDLYPTGGSLGDWAYKELRIPVITIETGLWFHQSDAEVADNLARNAGVLEYATWIADDPFGRVRSRGTGDGHPARSPASLTARRDIERLIAGVDLIDTSSRSDGVRYRDCLKVDTNQRVPARHGLAEGRGGRCCEAVVQQRPSGPIATLDR